MVDTALCVRAAMVLASLDFADAKCGSRGGGGKNRGSGPPPPGKSQVIWVSIGNKQLDPHWK